MPSQVDKHPNDIIKRAVEPFGSGFAVNTFALPGEIWCGLKVLPDCEVVHVFGYNPAVGTSYEDLWGPGGVYSWLSSDASFEILSNNANDSFTGSGAAVVRVEGLDGNFNPQSEDVKMNGTTPVVLSKTWRRLNRFSIIAAGSYHTAANVAPAGTITLRIAGGGATQAQIIIIDLQSNGKCLRSHYTVPAGYTAIMREVVFDVEATKPCNLWLWRRNNASDTTSLYSGAREAVVFAPSVDGEFIDTFYSPIIFHEKTDIWAGASVGSGTAEVSVGYTLLLYKNSAYSLISEPLQAVTGLSVESGDGEATLTWDAHPSADAGIYKVYVSTEAIESGTPSNALQVIEVANGTETATVTGLKNLTSYRVNVSCVSTADGRESPFNADQTVIPFSAITTQSLLLDGSTQYMTIPSDLTGASFIGGLTAATIGFWVKRDRLGVQEYLWDINDTRHFQLQITASNQWFFYARPDANDTAVAATVGTANSTSTWYFVCMIATTTVARFYVNGSVISQTGGKTWTNFATLAQTTYVGARASDQAQKFNGKIDHVGIWNKELSAAQISALYNSGAAIDYASNSGSYTSSANLINYWKLGEGDSVTALRDDIGDLEATTVGTPSFSSEVPA